MPPGSIDTSRKGVGRPNGPTYHAGTHKRGASVLHPLNPGPLLCSAWNVPSHMVVEVAGCYPLGSGDSCSTGPHRRGLPARAGHVRTVRPNTTWKPHDSGFLLTRPRKGFVGGVHAGDIGKGLGWSVGHTTDAHEGAPTSALSYTTSLRAHVTPTKPFSEPRVGSPPPVSNPSVAPVNTSAPEVAAVRPCPRPYP